MTSINDYYYYPSELSVTIMQGKEKCVVLLLMLLLFLSRVRAQFNEARTNSYKGALSSKCC